MLYRLNQEQTFILQELIQRRMEEIVDYVKSLPPTDENLKASASLGIYTAELAVISEVLYDEGVQE